MDSATTWFAIPVHLLKTQAQRRVVCCAFGLTHRKLAEMLAQTPDPDSSGLGHQIALRLVEGCPCLVYDHDDLAFGGTAIEDILQPGRVPYLRHNAQAAEFMATRSASAGDGDALLIACDHGGERPLIGARWVNGQVQLDPEEIADLDAYYRLRARLLSPT